MVFEDGRVGFHYEYTYADEENKRRCSGFKFPVSLGFGV